MKKVIILMLALFLSACDGKVSASLSNSLYSSSGSLASSSSPSSSLSNSISNSTSSQDLADHVSQLRSLYREPLDTVESTGYLSDEEAGTLGYETAVSDGYKYVYETHEAQLGFSELTMLGSMDNIWYPGAILKMHYDEKNNSNISAIPLPRAPMNLSVNLQTAKGINPDFLAATIEEPQLSSVRTTVGKMLQGLLTPETEIPLDLACEIYQIESQESLAMSLGLSANYGGFSADLGVNAKLDGDYTQAALVFKQMYFTIDMDIPYNNVRGVFSNEISERAIIDALPVGYVPVYTSVVYGRMAIIKIQTKMTMTALKATFNASYSSIAEINADVESVFRESETSMNYFIYGGSENQRGAITSSTISPALTKIVDVEMNSPSPIAYRFYHLDDGTIAKFATFNQYVIRRLVPIRVEDASLIYKKDGKETSEAFPGDILYPDLIINPENARIYETDFSISKSHDLQGNIYASIDSETGRLQILSNAMIGETIKITLRIAQNISGQLIVLLRDHYIKIIAISIKSIVIETDSETIEREGLVNLNAYITPSTVTHKQVYWQVESGDGYFINDEGIGATLRAFNFAPIDSYIKVYATSNEGVKSNVLTLRVKNSSKDISGIILDQPHRYLKIGEEVTLSSEIISGTNYSSDLKYVLEAGFRSASIKNGILQVLPGAFVGDVIKVKATCRGIQSTTITMVVAPAAQIVDNDDFYGIVLDRITAISTTHFILLNSSGNAVFETNISSGNTYAFNEIVKNYNGNGKYVVTYYMENNEQVQYSFAKVAGYAYGSGTNVDPYIITNMRHLKNINLNSDAYFALGENIDLKAQPWTPLNNFSGNFDGRNYNILNLKINVPSTNFVAETNFGLFKYNGGTIKNLSISNVSISGDIQHSGAKVNVGTLVGLNEGLIENVQVNGNLTGTNIFIPRTESRIGGIAGITRNGKINSSQVVNLRIYSDGDIGGIAGSAVASQITNCFFRLGTLQLSINKNNRSVGGIVGYAQNNSSILNSGIENVTIIFVQGLNIDASDLHPRIGLIVGHLANSLINDVGKGGDCKIESSKLKKYNGNWLGGGAYNQLKYVGNYAWGCVGAAENSTIQNEKVNNT